MPRKPRHRTRHASSAVRAFYDEISARLKPGRAVREQAVISLRYFPPTTPGLRSLEALLELRDEFGDELSPAAWLHVRIAALEAEK